MTKYRKNCLLIAVICLMLWLAGCASLWRDQIVNCTFPVADTEPIRKVRTLLLVEDGYVSIEPMREVIANVNEILSHQVGIEFVVTEAHVVSGMKALGYNKALNNLWRVVMEEGKYQDWDVVIGAIGKDWLDGVAFLAAQFMIPIPRWAGVVDDKYRRFCVLKAIDAQILAHEMMHLFILDYDHSDQGLMGAVAFSLLPGVSMGHVCLNEADRLAALKYKWREFDWDIRPGWTE